MVVICTLLLGLAAVGADGETREVRVYLVDRAVPDRDFKDAVAVLTLERPNGRGKTFLLPRISTPPCGEARGLIRGVPGTPYFVELNLGDANGEGPAPQGGCFGTKIPAELVSEPFTATVTVRLGNLSFTSEEFQGPRSKDDDVEEAAARVDRTLAVLRERAEQGAGFMDLRPAAVELIRDLARLSPAGFEDRSGAFERDRQWCLAQARAIEKAVTAGETGRIDELTRRCGPRLQNMKSSLAREKKSEPLPEPEVK